MANTRDLALKLRERVLPPGRSRYGLVIGIDRYQDARLDLRCAAADARLIHGLMVDPDCGVFAMDNVELLLDADATRDGIWRSLAGLRRKAGPEDTVWVYFAGHAAPEDDQTYWLAHDSDINDLYATGLGSGQISDVLSRVGADRRVVLLDCCHAAATTLQKNPTRAAVPAEELLGRFQGRGAVTLCSSDGGQRSVELEEHGHGAFTYYLERGLRGEADLDGDGVVTAEELWTYLEGKVAKAARQVGVDQSPLMIGQFSHGLPLSVCQDFIQARAIAAETVHGLIGLGRDDLSTEEARWCLELLSRPAANDQERQLLGLLEHAAASEQAVPGLRLAVLGAMSSGPRPTPTDVPEVKSAHVATESNRPPSSSPEQGEAASGRREREALEEECSRDVEACTTSMLRGKGSKEHLQAVHAERLPLWQRASEAKILDGMWLIARCLDNGLGGDRDESKAVALLLEAAEQGHALAQFNLGVCYHKGTGVSKDEGEAVRWYRKAAEQGDAQGQCNLGVCYELGSGLLHKEQGEAVRWYRKAAEQGDADAQCNLGVCYEYGTGVSKDEWEAVRWYRKAAEQGNAQAQCNLGVCYEFGTGVSKDEGEAVRWYRKAAEQGYARAQFNLGVSYEFGAGVSKDKEEAIRWYRKAADQGNEEAAKQLKEMQAKGCFISTAVTDTLGRPDDCEELMLLRQFRDSYMQESASRRDEVREYYRIAPAIVSVIEASGLAAKEWRRVSHDHVLPAVEAVRCGRLQEAHSLYRAMVRELEQQWLPDKELHRFAPSSQDAGLKADHLAFPLSPRP